MLELRQQEIFRWPGGSDRGLKQQTVILVTSFQKAPTVKTFLHISTVQLLVLGQLNPVSRLMIKKESLVDFSLRTSVLFFSFIPNKFLCDNAEDPKQRTKSFIQAMLKKNDLTRVGTHLNVTHFFNEASQGFKVTHHLISVSLTVSNMFCASLQERFRLQLRSPVGLETGLFWRHHAL